MVDVILPVLDEALALPWVLGRMPADCRAIVVDNGSTDGSAAVALAHGATVVDEPRRGFGAACFAGLTAARADVVCFMDADASMDPRQLERVAGPVLAGSADLVLGARRPTSMRAWPLARINFSQTRPDGSVASIAFCTTCPSTRSRRCSRPRVKTWSCKVNSSVRPRCAALAARRRAISARSTPALEPGELAPSRSWDISWRMRSNEFSTVISMSC